MINLLAGSLAEAKYVALQDDEVFNANLINLDALHFYGGNSDLEVISEYMECFLPNKTERDQKLVALFFEAYGFVKKRSNWLAISALAEYILAQDTSLISCEDVMLFLDTRE